MGLRIAQRTGFEMGNPIWGDDVVSGNPLSLGLYSTCERCFY